MKNIITLAGVKYTAEIKDGVPYIDGMSVDEFLDELENKGKRDIIYDLAKIGAKMVDNTLTFGSPQQEADQLWATRKMCN